MNSTFCRAMGSNEDTLFTFMVGIPTTNRSTNRSLFKDPKLQRRYTTTSNIDTKDYIITAVSGTKVNIVDVFNYEFPTYIISTIAAAKNGFDTACTTPGRNEKCIQKFDRQT